MAMALSRLSPFTSPAVLASRSFSTTRPDQKNMVLVDGVRTPFLMSGTDYKNLMPHDLQRYALTGLVNKTGIDKNIVDYICMGTVIQVIFIDINYNVSTIQFLGSENLQHSPRSCSWSWVL